MRAQCHQDQAQCHQDQAQCHQDQGAMPPRSGRNALRPYVYTLPGWELLYPLQY